MTVAKLSNTAADIIFGSPFHYESVADASRAERELDAELAGYLSRLDALIAASPTRATHSRQELAVTAAYVGEQEDAYPVTPEIPVGWDE